MSLLDESTSQDTSYKESLESLHQLLRLERVAFGNKIAQGVFEADPHRVRLESSVGLKNTIGYFVNQIHHLRPHEALYLIEMSKLRVTYDEVIMSLEQAYQIFLNCENAICLEEYLVYSHLMRCGYNMKLYNPNRSAEIRPEYSLKVSEKDQMVWKVYRQKQEDEQLELSESQKDLFDLIKSRMNENCRQISGRELLEHSEPPSKKTKTEYPIDLDSHVIDILQHEQSFKTYRELVNKFDFIQRHQVATTGDEVEDLNFHFDVFTAKQTPSEDIPRYRILVVKSSSNFPSNLALDRLKKRQKLQTTSVIAVVTDALSIHFCVYDS